MGQSRPDIKFEIIKKPKDGRPIPILLFRGGLMGAANDKETIEDAKKTIGIYNTH